MPMGTFDAPVLVAHAAIVARAHHAVVIEQLAVARSPIVIGLQILIGCRQAVGAMFARSAAGHPECALQATGQCLEALASFVDLCIIPAGERKHEVIQNVRKRHATDGHAEWGDVGEVRQTHLAGHMLLGEEHLAWRPTGRAPDTDTALQGTQHGIRVLTGILLLDTAHQGDAHETRLALKQRPDLCIPNTCERISGRAPRALGLLGGKRGRRLNPAGAADANACFGSGNFLRVCFAVLHIQMYLTVCYSSSWHDALCSCKDVDPKTLNPTAAGWRALRRLRRLRAHQPAKIVVADRTEQLSPRTHAISGNR